MSTAETLARGDEIDSASSDEGAETTVVGLEASAQRWRLDSDLAKRNHGGSRGGIAPKSDIANGHRGYGTNGSMGSGTAVVLGSARVVAGPPPFASGKLHRDGSPPGSRTVLDSGVTGVYRDAPPNAGEPIASGARVIPQSRLSPRPAAAQAAVPRTAPHPDGTGSIATHGITPARTGGAPGQRRPLPPGPPPSGASPRGAGDPPQPSTTTAANGGLKISSAVYRRPAGSGISDLRRVASGTTGSSSRPPVQLSDLILEGTNARRAASALTALNFAGNGRGNPLLEAAAAAAASKGNMVIRVPTGPQGSPVGLQGSSDVAYVMSSSQRSALSRWGDRARRSAHSGNAHSPAAHAAPDGASGARHLPRTPLPAGSAPLAPRAPSLAHSITAPSAPSSAELAMLSNNPVQSSPMVLGPASRGDRDGSEAHPELSVGGGGAGLGPSGSDGISPSASFASSSMLTSPTVTANPMAAAAAIAAARQHPMGAGAWGVEAGALRPLPPAPGSVGGTGRGGGFHEEVLPSLRIDSGSARGLPGAAGDCDSEDEGEEGGAAGLSEAGSPIIKVSRGGEMATSMLRAVSKEKRKSLRPRHIINKHLKKDDEQWQAKRARKKAEKRIHERHRLYHLSYGMMLGMWVCMNKTKPGDKLHIDDFNSVLKLHFRREGTAETPPLELPHSFKFKDYAPKVFRHLRERFGVNADEYKRSLGGFYDFIEFQSNSKSGQFFFFSHDGRFMIKTQTRAESTFLRRIIPHYFRYVVENPGTFLPRFYGLHRIKMAHIGRVTHFTVMHSVFDSSRYDDLMKEIYDLKGSWVGRAATEEEKSRPPGKFVSKDNDLTASGRVFRVGKTRAAAMLAQIRRDAEFLCSMQIMDYSLLVSVRDKVTEEAVAEMQEDIAVEQAERRAARAAAKAAGVDTSASDGEGDASAVAAGSSSSAEGADESARPASAAGLPPSARAAASGAGGPTPHPPAGHRMHGPPSTAASAAAARARRERRHSRMPRAHVVSAGSGHQPPSFARSGLSAFNLHAVDTPEHSGAGVAAVGHWGSSGGSSAEDEASVAGAAPRRGTAAGVGVAGASASSAEASDGGGHGVDGPPADMESPTPAIPPVDDFDVSAFSGIPRSHGPVPSCSKDGDEGEEVFYFGIIDILQQYNIRKNLETFGRALIAPRHGISCVPPAEYAKRFVKFLERHVV